MEGESTRRASVHHTSIINSTVEEELRGITKSNINHYSVAQKHDRLIKLITYSNQNALAHGGRANCTPPASVNDITQLLE